MTPEQEPTVPPRNKLANLSLWVAAGSCVAVYMGLGLAAFGEGLQGGRAVQFFILLWTGFTMSLIALVLAIISLYQQRTFTAGLSILICVWLYVSWFFFGLIQP